MALAAVTDRAQALYSTIVLAALSRRTGMASASFRGRRPDSPLGRRSQSDRPPGRRGKGAHVIMLGSHSDTVPSGGRFDGPAGIIAALEVVRAMQASGLRAPACDRDRGFPCRGAERIRRVLRRQPRHGRRARQQDARLSPNRTAKISPTLFNASAAIRPGWRMHDAPTLRGSWSFISSKASFSRTAGSISAW